MNCTHVYNSQTLMNHILSLITPADPLRLAVCAEVVLIVVLWQLRWYRRLRWDDVQRQIRRVREG